MSELPPDAPPEFGKGAIQSEPDPRDLVVGSVALEPVVGAGSLPSRFLLGQRPPVSNQGNTPQCVAYSTAYDQNWQDRKQHGRFFNFDEGTFFAEIGGGPNGAVVRNALDRLLFTGYPEQDATPARELHQIDGYASVTIGTAAIKQAIMGLGGGNFIGPWWPSWEHPLGARAVLPPASGYPAGHAWWAVGWDEFGCIGQNSWGSAWGDGGLFRMPWPYVLQSMWDFRTTVDDVNLQLIARGVIKEVGSYLRKPRQVTGDDAGQLEPSSIWGQARKAGIWRASTKTIVATPWDRPFKYRGRRTGARHGIGSRPQTWALLGIAGTVVALPAPLVRLVA